LCKTEFEFQITYKFLWTNVYQVETDLTTFSVEPILPLFVTISLVVVTKQQQYQMCRLLCSHYGFIPMQRKLSLECWLLSLWMRTECVVCLGFRFDS